LIRLVAIRFPVRAGTRADRVGVAQLIGTEQTGTAGAVDARIADIR
jgi:hypothetical protein